jgi:hypothetical protein
MVIRVRDFAPGADTSEEGARLFDLLNSAMGTQGLVTVSFDGIQTATSSFVNAAFVELLSRFSYGDIKLRIRVTDSTRQINDMIKTRLERSNDMVA